MALQQNSTQCEELARRLELHRALSCMMVHDLRNPLSAVMLYLQLLQRRGSGDPLQARYLELALCELHKMSDFLHDMVVLERSKPALVRSPLSLDRIVGHALEKFAALAAAEGVTLTAHLPAQPYPLSADVTLLQRVVEDLVANALKFAPAGSTVAVEVAYPGDAQLRLSVLDQGRGIPPGDTVRMFDPYEAVVMKEQGKAELGLELAFCRMVAEAHGGRIYARNNPDRGAAITIEF
jgi:two-component system, sensor histidine kinase and response regulator